MDKAMIVRPPEPDYRDTMIASLHREIDSLNRQILEAQGSVAEAKADAARAVAALRRQLSPLFNALKLVFGEIDAVAGPEDAAPAQSNPKWESWKKQLPGRPAEAIDLLLLHESMSVKQFMAAMHCGKDAVYQVMSKLGQAGIVVNSGGRYSLKH